MMGGGVQHRNARNRSKERGACGPYPLCDHADRVHMRMRAIHPFPKCGALTPDCGGAASSVREPSGTNLTLDTAAVQPNTSGKQAAIIRVFPAQAGTHV